MNSLWYIGAFLLALAPLIVVHEFGHYIVARWCGVKVLRFSVGFGKPLFLKKWGRDETEWVVAAIPFGGFVRMLDEREAPVPAELFHRAFNRQSVYKRMAVVVAGPLANLVLATVVYCGIFMYGVTDLKPVLGPPLQNTPAATAGFESGETVKTVNGQPVAGWTQLRKLLMNAALDKSTLNIELVGKDNTNIKRVLRLDALPNDFDTDPTEGIGLMPFRPRMDAVVGSITGNSPAALAGFEVNDLIVAINDEPIPDWEQVVKHIRPAYGQTLKVAIRRAGEQRVYSVVPAEASENGQVIGRLGIAVKPDPARYEPFKAVVREYPLPALGHAIAEVWNTSVLSLRMMGRMVLGQISLRNVSGPVTIADYAGQSAKLGVPAYLSFIALISISLGVLNLLPIPILDGGHLLYYLVEFFKGSPLSDRVLEAGQKIGAGFLGLLMLLAFYNDIHRLLAG